MKRKKPIEHKARVMKGVVAGDRKPQGSAKFKRLASAVLPTVPRETMSAIEAEAAVPPPVRPDLATAAIAGLAEGPRLGSDYFEGVESIEVIDKARETDATHETGAAPCYRWPDDRRKRKANVIKKLRPYAPPVRTISLDQVVPFDQVVPPDPTSYLPSGPARRAPFDGMKENDVDPAGSAPVHEDELGEWPWGSYTHSVAAEAGTCRQ